MMGRPPHDEPDPGVRELQHGRQRRWGRGTRIGALVVAAAIGLVALALIVGKSRVEHATTPVGENVLIAAGVPVTQPSPRKADYVLDLNTGAVTPLPEAITQSLDTSGKRELYASQASRYAASPDGSRLAYVGIGDEGSPQIFTAGIDGSGVRQVTHDPRSATSPAWSPDETMIAYDGYGSGDVRNLFVVDIATGESTQVTDATRDLWGHSQFTPDGQSLFYSGGSQSVPELRTVPVAGGRSTILFGRSRGGMADAANGSLSPDGSLVTMMGSRIGGPGALRFVANADGTELRSVPGRDSNHAGTWSPDGSRIVCRQWDEGGGLIVIDVATARVVSRVAQGRAAIWLDRHTLLVEA